MTIPPEVNEDRRRRLANQRLYRHCYVSCSCDRGCYVCAYTGLVTKAHAKGKPATSGESPTSVRSDTPAF